MLNCSAVALKEWCQVFVSLCNLATQTSSLCSTRCDSTRCSSDQMLSCIQTLLCWSKSQVSHAANIYYPTFLSLLSGRTRIHNYSLVHHVMSKQPKLKTGLVYSVPCIGIYRYYVQCFSTNLTDLEQYLKDALPQISRFRIQIFKQILTRRLAAVIAPGNSIDLSGWIISNQHIYGFFVVV